MTDLKARLRDLSTRQKRIESRETLMEAVERIAELEAVSLERMTAQELNGAALGAERAAHSLTRERVAGLERRQIPPSWSSDGNEWSAISGGGVLDVRGSKADIDVVVSWRQAKDRLAWFEDEYRKSQARETALNSELSALTSRVDRVADKMAEVDKFDELDVEELLVGLRSDLLDAVRPHASAEETFKRQQAGEAYFTLQAKYDRLLVAFHDATRRPMGVTPDTGLEFYDHRLADEAEARRTRYGRGPK